MSIQTANQSTVRSAQHPATSKRHSPLGGLVKAGLAIAGATALTLGGAVAANAHISVDSDNPAAGANTILTFTLPHGCGISPTTELAIQIPEGVSGVQPIRQPFYEVEVVWETLEAPDVDGHGNEVTERIAEVIYTANTPLPSELRDTFDIAARLPADAAGQTVHFPVLQTCEEGDYAWIQIAAEGQDPHDLDAPAPGLLVIEGSGDDHGHGHGSDGDHGDGDGDGDGDHGSADSGDTAVSDGGSADADHTASEASSGASDQTPLIVTALAVGGVGLIVGVVALLRSRPRAA